MGFLTSTREETATTLRDRAEANLVAYEAERARLDQAINARDSMIQSRLAALEAEQADLRSITL